jgi:hypothetical protein
VKSPKEWPWSSFDEYVKKEIYPEDWAAGDDIEIDGVKFD